MEIEEEVIKVDASGKVHYFHWLIVTLSAVVTIVSWYITKTQIDEKVKIQFDREADQVIELISERMRKYEDALWGGVSTIQSHGGDISHESWLTFSESLRIDTKYPGINGIGVIHNIQKSELEIYLIKQQKSRKNFKIHPKHNNSEYWPITYIEPLKLNIKAVGLDMAHENNRYTAAIKARDTGKAQITGPIVLVQDSGKTPGFLFYAPFFKAKKRNTLKDRRENVVGLVYAPFVVKKLMEGVLEKSRRRVGIHINDKDDVLYEEHTSSNSDYDSNFLFQKFYEVEYYGRVWSFDIRSTLSFRDSIINHQAKIILFAGIIIDFLLLCLFLYLAKSNKKAIDFGFKITEKYQQKARDLEIASNAKGNFLANMSHEIRTPMNGVLGMLSLLEDTKLNIEQAKLVKIIKSCGDSLLIILNDILDFSKLEINHLTLENIPFNLKKCAEDTVSLLEYSAEVKGIELVLEYDESIAQNVLGDITRLRQVLVNLLSNAIKFSSKGTVYIIIKKVEGNEILFEIKDQGIGISKIDQEKLFNSFTQVDPSISRKFGGTGLGLAISQRIINLMGGNIWIESKEGVGASFLFKISLEPVFVDCGEEVNLYEEKKFSSDLRILVVEDNTINQVLIIKLLEKFGFNADIANNGLESIHCIRKKTYDLVLMDMQMPIMDGVTATKKIVEEFGELKPRIVAMTANVFPDDQKKCFEAGMDDFLGKPIVKEKLIKILYECENNYKK